MRRDFPGMLVLRPSRFNLLVDASPVAMADWDALVLITSGHHRQSTAPSILAWKSVSNISDWSWRQSGLISSPRTHTGISGAGAYHPVRKRPSWAVFFCRSGTYRSRRERESSGIVSKRNRDWEDATITIDAYCVATGVVARSWSWYDWSWEMASDCRTHIDQ